MADELEIDIELSNELIDEMTKQCNAVVNNITKIKTTTAWTWAHCHPQEKDGLKEYILSTMAPPKDLTEEKTKTKIDIVEFSFPKLLGFNFCGIGVRGLDERPNESPCG